MISVIAVELQRAQVTQSNLHSKSSNSTTAFSASHFPTLHFHVANLN